MIIIAIFLLTSIVQSQDCVLTAIVSIYQCQATCQTIYGSEASTQRLFFNQTSLMCQPKTTCPTGWTYINTNNTCVSDLGQKYNVINGVILSSNMNNATFLYLSCNNGYFQKASCYCKPGWNSSLTNTSEGINQSRIQYCDVQIPKYNNTASSGQNTFNGYTMQDKRNALGEVFPAGEDWVSPLVVVSVVVYGLVLLVGIHHCLTKPHPKKKPPKSVVV